MRIEIITNPTAKDTCSMFSMAEETVDRLMDLVKKWKNNYENFNEILLELEKEHSEGNLTDQEAAFCFYAIGIHHGKEAAIKANMLRQTAAEHLKRIIDGITDGIKPDIGDVDDKIKNNYKL